MDDDAKVLVAALRKAGMPADLAALKPSCLDAPFAEAGVRKIGVKHRLISLLHQWAAERTTIFPMISGSLTSGGGEDVIPRRLFTFWRDGPMAAGTRAAVESELVKCCLALMQYRCTADRWTFRLLRGAETDLPDPPVDPSGLSGAQLADWYRLCALSAYGGVYLDATCILLQPIEKWVDLRSEAVQGFEFVPDGDTMESWAVAAPGGSAFCARWRDEFGKALKMGVRSYCDSLPRHVLTHPLCESLPYLAIHAAWRVVRAEMPETPFRLVCATFSNPRAAVPSP